MVENPGLVGIVHEREVEIGGIVDALEEVRKVVRWKLANCSFHITSTTRLKIFLIKDSSVPHLYLIAFHPHELSLHYILIQRYQFTRHNNYTRQRLDRIPRIEGHATTLNIKR